MGIVSLNTFMKLDLHLENRLLVMVIDGLQCEHPSNCIYLNWKYSGMGLKPEEADVWKLNFIFYLLRNGNVGSWSMGNRVCFSIVHVFDF